ncbi:MAG TPA: flagellar hook-basal body complex protein FliE [Pseudomonas sp.]|jgi:flagellar hook-basal body complex protein FliE|uniref:flagellar hook-basal body complex protein FliE n=1 Tax=Pseudomonas sp. TaxID=306 RepID=UPI002B67F900|nr:flagellar hook-basal body complex protein FliE [Pseudomonas sp.]HTO19656.1 flagellar hook-basal body complex protein FliE [Pseudomonas sp.]
MDSITQVRMDMLTRMQQFTSVAQGGAVREALRAEEAQPGSFGVSFEQLIRAVDADQHRASAAQRAVEMGESDDLVGAMVDSQKASVSFSALLQVRNKLSSAFDEILKTPL